MLAGRGAEGEDGGVVQRLAGSDAGFLFVEGPTMTSTCLDLVELGARPPGVEPLTVHRIRELLAERLADLPSFRWRIADVPLDVHHPVWVEDPDFDLGYHVRAVTLPAPGGPAEVEAQFVSMLPALLDRRHPLWRLTLLDGLAGDRQALVFSFHPSPPAGAALITTLDRLFSPPSPFGAVDLGAEVPDPPKPSELLAGAL